jgi:HSP20 family protein
MASRRDWSLFNEIEEMRAHMDSLINRMTDAAWPALTERGMATRMLPAARGEFNVDVRENDQEVVVMADIPGVDKSDIRIDLINPRALEITCERKNEKREETENYFMRERTFGSVSRVVPLPSDAIREGSSAAFRNGVLEVRLKKGRTGENSRIPIE